LAYETQLSEPDFVSQSISFTNFLSTWLIRQADPKKTHPHPTVECVIDIRGDKSRLMFPTRLPLPKEVPMSFRVLPEYLVEDIVDYLYFAVQYVTTQLAQQIVTDDASKACS
jgi:ubiquitin conjugation factor E4 B